jgi:hypothetical protein
VPVGMIRCGGLDCLPVDGDRAVQIRQRPGALKPGLQAAREVGQAPGSIGIIRWGPVDGLAVGGDRAVQIRQCPGALEPRLPRSACSDSTICGSRSSMNRVIRVYRAASNSRTTAPFLWIRVSEGRDSSKRKATGMRAAEGSLCGYRPVWV